MPDFSTDTTGLQPIDAREYISSGDREAPRGPSKFAQALDFLVPMAQTGMSSGLIKAPQVLNVAMSAALGGGQPGGGMSGGPAMFGGQSAGKFMTGNIPAPPAPPGGGSGGLAGLGAPPPPGGGMGGNPAAMGGMAGMGGVDQYGGQIDAMFNNNMMFMMLQTKVQNMSQQFQAVSNIYKADHDARTNAIRNFRS